MDQFNSVPYTFHGFLEFVRDRYPRAHWESMPISQLADLFRAYIERLREAGASAAPGTLIPH